MTTPRSPVTPDDLRVAARLCTATLRPVQDSDWSVPARGLRWSCRKTLDHLCDCLAWYAHDLGAEIQTEEGAARHGFPRASIPDLVRSVETLSEVLAIVAAAKGPEVRAWHSWGMADAEGFLAMGTAEILLHSWDIAGGFGVELAKPRRADDLATRLLPRLFPDAPGGDTPFATLLALTGRPRPPERRQARTWRWQNAPLSRP